MTTACGSDGKDLQTSRQRFQTPENQQPTAPFQYIAGGDSQQSPQMAVYRNFLHFKGEADKITLTPLPKNASADK